MAKIRKGIMGPFSGKVGPIVGSSWKNVAYIKAAPVTNGQKRVYTAAQLANQQRFKLMNDFLDPFQPYISVGFANLAIGRTELNTAFMINFQEAMELVDSIYQIQYNKVCLSKGKLPGLQEVAVNRDDNGKLTLTWATDLSNASANDQLMLVIYCPALKMADGFVGLAQRSGRSVQFQLHQKMQYHSIELYLSMVSLNRKKVSNSQYLGRMEP